MITRRNFTIATAVTEVVPSLIVINARTANLQGNKLLLTGISPNTIRPPCGYYPYPPCY